MNETDLASRVHKALAARGIPHRKIWQGPYSHRGTSDIIGTLPPAGRAFFIELKAPGKYKPPSKGMTPAQAFFLAEMEAAGALCACCDSVEQVLLVLGLVRDPSA